jgi:brefeldin A-inhibited guanine nucleotide-exchange protein
VLLNEIVLPILEMRNSTAKQKSTVMSMVSRLCQDPQALVEIYLNYDCDSEALQNVYERLMNIVSKIGATPTANLPKGASEPPTSAASSRRSNLSVASVPPSLTTATLGVNAAQDAAGQTPAAAGAAEARLKRQGLDCLVAVLRSLVQWGTSPGKIGTGIPTGEQTPVEIASQHRTRTSDDTSTLAASNSNMSTERLSPAIPDQVAGLSTSSLSLDDPGHFESAKLRKTTLLEGIKRFNFKPKRVRD